jgi:hypothetical protein
MQNPELISKSNVVHTSTPNITDLAYHIRAMQYSAPVATTTQLTGYSPVCLVAFDAPPVLYRRGSLRATSTVSSVCIPVALTAITTAINSNIATRLVMIFSLALTFYFALTQAFAVAYA